MPEAAETAKTPADLHREVPEWVFYDESRKIQTFHDIGLLEKDDLAVFNGIIEYAQKYHTAYLPLQGLIRHLMEYGTRENVNALKTENGIAPLLKRVCSAIARFKYCGVESEENRVVAFILKHPNRFSSEELAAFLAKIRKYYLALDADTTKPFLGADIVPAGAIPEERINTESMQNLTPERIRELELSDRPLTKIILSGSSVILIPSQEAGMLYRRASDKLRKFLIASPELTSLVIAKMKQKAQSTGTVSAINNVNDLLSPDRRDPRHFIALATEVMNYTQNSDRQQAFYQAADIVKNLAILQSDQEQKQVHHDKTMEVLAKIMETYSIPFSKKQLLQLREKHNYLKLYTERDYIELVNQYLDKYTKPRNDNAPPVIVTFKIGGETRYIHRDNVFRTFFDKMDSLGFELHKEFQDSYTRDAVSFINSRLMKNQSSLDEYAGEFVRKKDPFADQIVSNDLLFFQLLSWAATKDPKAAKQLYRFFETTGSYTDTPRKRGWAEMLSIDRHRLLEEAQLHLPLFYRIPILHMLMMLFRGFGRKMGKAIDSGLEDKKNAPKFGELVPPRKSVTISLEKLDAKPSPADEARNASERKKSALKEKLTVFRKSLTGGEDPKALLSQLESKWNRKLNPQARKENYEVVMGKIKSRMKFMKQFTPEAIQQEALDLSKTDETLKGVNDIEALKKFIGIYISETVIQKLGTAGTPAKK